MRANEFIAEARDEELDEFLPLIAAAGGALARGAAAGAEALGGAAVRGAAAAGRGIAQGAKALGRGAAAVGRGVGQVASDVSQGMAAKAAAQQDQDQDSNQIKAGGRVSVPKLGAVDIIAVTPTGVTLNTRTQLGFNITVDPRDLQR